jgi:hypothetical protein
MFIALAALALAALAASLWPVHSKRDLYHYHYRRSSSLALSLLARTNGNVLVSVKNSGNQQFEMFDGASIEYLNPASPEDSIAGDYYYFTNSRFNLLPGAAFQASFPAPTKHLKWRAYIGGIGQREVALKTRMKRALNWTVVLRRYPLLIYPEYAQTDWIAP